MQNILIVCADKELRKEISKVLATELKFLYVDVDDVLDYELLNNQDVSLVKAEDMMNNLETKSINRVLKFNDCITTISNDVFVSNDNFRLFKDIKKVFLKLPKAYFVSRTKKEDKYKLDQTFELLDSINKLISINCDIVIDKEIKSTQEISKEIIEKLNNNTIK